LALHADCFAHYRQKFLFILPILSKLAHKVSRYKVSKDVIRVEEVTA